MDGVIVLDGEEEGDQAKEDDQNDDDGQADKNRADASSTLAW